MKLVQQESFSPIAIILETREEAEMFWSIMRNIPTYFGPEAREMINEISNLFSTEAHL